MAYTTIDDPELFFQVKIYSGDGNNDRSIVLDGDNDMQPDMVIITERNTTSGSALQDSVVTGVGGFLKPYSTGAEDSSSNRLKSFTSDGFTVGTSGATNGGSDTYVAWCWKESATAGFDIVGYTGNGSNRTISHSLSAVPKWMLVKRRDDAGGWITYHQNIGNTHILEWHDTGAAQSSASSWNNTTPTSSVFSVGDANAVNINNGTFVNYLWSSVQGFSKFGKFVGNGNNDGPYIHLGFRPAFLIIKETSNADDWQYWDHKREDYPGNPNDTTLDLGGSSEELDSANRSVDFLANGFKLRTSNATINTNTESFIYVAYAIAPFVNSKGLPGVGA